MQRGRRSTQQFMMLTYSIPAGSFTVLAIGPAEDDVIDSIVSHLKLLESV